MENSKVTSMLQVESDNNRDQKIIDAGFLPGWIGEGGLRPEPIQDFEPSFWEWETGRTLLEATAASIDPRVAERRNIRMANSAAEKRTSLNTIHCSYQMVAPGEFARAHRHTVNAGRFILESDGAFTTLNGEKVLMEPNDIILTPNWLWHGLGNEDSKTSAFWVDFLDDPLVSALKTIFFEVRDENHRNMPVNKSSPHHIKWSDLDNRLQNILPDSSGKYGRRIQLETPSIPTMGLYIERFDKDIPVIPPKSTANHLFICAEGTGQTQVGEKIFFWNRGDVIAVPSWISYNHCASSSSTLIEITDLPVIEALGWYREVDI